MRDKFYIGLDIGGTQIKMGILRNNVLLDENVFPALSKKRFQANLDMFREEINIMLIKHDVKNNLGGIGFAFAGLVDVKEKKIISTNEKYNDAKEADIEKWVVDHWNVPFFIDNDTRMATVGEWKYGAGKGHNDIVMVTLGTGIGTSAIIEGKLLRGKHYQAGCLGGHFTVQVNGNPCGCGNVGCAEAHASSWSIKDRIQKDKSFERSLLATSEKLDFYHLFKASQKNDSLANRIKKDCLDVWSANIVSLIHAYDPDIVVLGGGIMNSKDEIIPYLEQKVHQNAWTPWGKVKINASQLMNKAALFGLNYCLQHQI